jgi:hypothetical protein
MVIWIILGCIAIVILTALLVRLAIKEGERIMSIIEDIAHDFSYINH